MPLERKDVVARFLKVVPLTRYSTCYHGAFEALSVKLQKAETEDFLESITLSFPPLKGEHASRYESIVRLFWQCVLPPDSPPADYTTRAMDTLKHTGSYNEMFGDIRVSFATIGTEFFLKAYTS